MNVHICWLLVHTVVAMELVKAGESQLYLSLDCLRVLQALHLTTCEA